MLCSQCGGPMPTDATPARVTCSGRCRQARSIAKRAEMAAAAAETLAAHYGRALAPTKG